MREETTPSCYKIGLIACSKAKSREPRLAKDLYRGDLFQKCRRYLELRGIPYYILSAKLGIISPDEIVDPYDCTLASMSPSQRREWASRVGRSIEKIEPRGGRLLVLAGKRYRTFKDYLPAEKYELEIPLAGKGIGKQQAWLKQQIQALLNS